MLSTMGCVAIPAQDATEALEKLRQIAPGSYDAGLGEVYYTYYVLNDFDEVLPAFREASPDKSAPG